MALGSLYGLTDRCTSCPLNDKHQYAFSVPGIGHLDPVLMLIGEGPGYHESVEHRPFVGQAGKLLQKTLAELGMDFSELYITNVVKHRPPDNRIPSELERATCTRLYLEEELELVQPQQIVCLGRVATETLAELSGTALPNGSLRGFDFTYQSTPATGTWHPAYVLRNQTRLPELRNDVKEAYESARTKSKAKFDHCSKQALGRPD